MEEGKEREEERVWKSSYLKRREAERAYKGRRFNDVVSTPPLWGGGAIDDICRQNRGGHITISMWNFFYDQNVDADMDMATKNQKWHENMKKTLKMPYFRIFLSFLVFSTWYQYRQQMTGYIKWVQNNQKWQIFAKVSYLRYETFSFLSQIWDFFKILSYLVIFMSFFISAFLLPIWWWDRYNQKWQKNTKIWLL